MDLLAVAKQAEADKCKPQVRAAGRPVARRVGQRQGALAAAAEALAPSARLAVGRPCASRRRPAGAACRLSRCRPPPFFPGPTGLLPSWHLRARALPLRGRVRGQAREFKGGAEDQGLDGDAVARCWHAAASGRRHVSPGGGGAAAPAGGHRRPVRLPPPPFLLLFPPAVRPRRAPLLAVPARRHAQVHHAVRGAGRALPPAAAGPEPRTALRRLTP